MGSTVAAGWASAVDEGLCNLEVALYAHLRGNFYPPVPAEVVPAAKAAIEAGNAGEWDKVVFHSLANGRPMTASEVVDQLHLEFFLDSDTEEEC